MTPDIEALVARHEAVFRAHVPMFPSITCADDRESWPCSTLMDLARRADALTAAEARYDALRTLLGNVLDRSTPMHSTTCAGQDDDAPCICGTAEVIEAAHDPHVEH